MFDLCTVHTLETILDICNQYGSPCYEKWRSFQASELVQTAVRAKMRMQCNLWHIGIDVDAILVLRHCRQSASLNRLFLNHWPKSQKQHRHIQVVWLFLQFNPMPSIRINPNQYNGLRQYYESKVLHSMMRWNLKKIPHRNGLWRLDANSM